LAFKRGRRPQKFMLRALSRGLSKLLKASSRSHMLCLPSIVEGCVGFFYERGGFEKSVFTFDVMLVVVGGAGERNI